MESYKHSCPCCGQHIEYTAGYCGRQMQCPMCGHTVTFPAIPPQQRAGASLHLVTSESKPRRSLARFLPGFLLFLIRFQHWKVVGQCAVPFLVMGLLLAVAAFVKTKLGDAPAPVSIPTVQADPQAWQRVTELTKADQVVRQRMKELAEAHAVVAAAEKENRQLTVLDPMQKRRAEGQMQLAQNNLNNARRLFEDAFANYARLGGAVDYRSQLPNY